jgi:hypothetical protein
MVTVPQQTLPLSTTSAMTMWRERADAAGAASWQSQLHRAAGRAEGLQLAHPDFQPAATATVRTSGPCAAADQPRIGMQAPVGPCVQVDGESPTAAVHPQLGFREAATPVRSSSEARAPDRPARSVPSAVPAAPDPGPHVHVERNASGVAVWIGCSGSLEQTQRRVAGVLTQLRQEAAAAGEHVRLLVCNGSTVYAAEPAKEIP